MSILSAIRKFFSRSSCEKLIKYDARSIEMGALGAEFGGVKFSLASFKTGIQKVREASEAAVTMDDYQYDLCKIAYECEKGSPERIQCNKWRIGAVSLFTGLRATLIAFKENQSEELAKDLESITREIRRFVMAVAKAVITPAKAAAKPHMELDEKEIYQLKREAPFPTLKGEAERVSPNEVLSRAFKVAGLKPSDVEKIAAQA